VALPEPDSLERTLDAARATARSVYEAHFSAGTFV
jgi:hypothetical protein